jgi:NAD(P)-dependent dehydrogenase (short-subunit alcohol dehydrogenase family)
MSDLTNYLVFGASGSIGAACTEKLQLIGKITGGSRNLEELERQIDSISRFDGVIWAQGINATDSAEIFQVDAFEKIMEANVTFILRSLKVLLDAGRIQPNSQLVVVSSVWSQLSRPNKMSYGISKAAVGGLVRSMAVDLGPLGIQINAVSPGPIDTPMTIKNLKPEELERVISESPLKRLVNLSEVASVVCELVTGKLSGVTGQEIVVDSGWSVSKLV